MKTKKTFEIEIQRSNVTPAQFLAYVRSRVDAKGGKMLRSDLDLAYFKAGNDLNFDIHHEEPEFDGLHEKSISKPYEMQTFLSYSNGACYNEICEFEFDDEKTGHGYYYLVNVETVEETAEEIVEAVEQKVSEAETHGIKWGGIWGCEARHYDHGKTGRGHYIVTGYISGRIGEEIDFCANCAGILRKNAEEHELREAARG